MRHPWWRTEPKRAIVFTYFFLLSFILSFGPGGLRASPVVADASEAGHCCERKDLPSYLGITRRNIKINHIFLIFLELIFFFLVAQQQKKYLCLSVRLSVSLSQILSSGTK